MSDNQNSLSFNDINALVIPAFGKLPAHSLDWSSTREAERRIIEAQRVNPITYAELEYVFNESYRDLKRHFSTVTFLLSQAEKAMEVAKSDILLDKYPEFMKDKPKTQDNADLRKAFFMRDPEYLAALDQIDKLKAFESLIDGRIKVMERVCAYMKKQMDLIIRSGLSGSNLYITSGNK